ncbi:unnamed protein product [Orchesella dallaii]|uniref:Daxx histone-binding domain-containing protein n=1 Tax=Orchesella dallaii TaxID=48710 RepID=A0ABP1QQK4_9HEXA
MAAVSAKMGFEDDIICLSSSDEEPSPVSCNDILDTVLNPRKFASSPIVIVHQVHAIVSSDDEIQVLNGNDEPEVQERLMDSELEDSVAIVEKVVVHSFGRNSSKRPRIEDSEPMPGPSTGLTKANGCADYVKLNREATEQFLNDLRRKSHIKGKHLQKVRSKLDKVLDEIEHLPQNVLENLHSEIENAIEAISNLPSKPWGTISQLLDLMSPSKVILLHPLTPEAQELRRQIEIQKARDKLEKEMKKIHQKIAYFDEQEVDFSDEDDHNSPYILVDKFTKKFITGFYRACDVHKSSRFTDRPVQKKINLKKCGANCSYDQINVEVERFLNKKGFLFNPDFKDIHNIVIKVNKSARLSLSEDEVWRSARETFTKVALVIKKRRQKDNLLTLSDLMQSDNIKDPADQDEELRRKLENNDRNRRSEAEVLDHYIKLQEEQGKTAEEVADEEDIDASPPPSDNEEDDEETEDTDDGDEITLRDRPDQDELVDEADDDEDETVLETDCFKLAMGQSSEVISSASETQLIKVRRVERKENKEGSIEVQMAQPTESLATEKRSREAEDEPPLKRIRTDELNDFSDSTTDCSAVEA